MMIFLTIGRKELQMQNVGVMKKQGEKRGDFPRGKYTVSTVRTSAARWNAVRMESEYSPC
jgi:hypothetical protein